MQNYQEKTLVRNFEKRVISQFDAGCYVGIIFCTAFAVFMPSVGHVSLLRTQVAVPIEFRDA